MHVHDEKVSFCRRTSPRPCTPRARGSSARRFASHRRKASHVASSTCAARRATTRRHRRVCSIHVLYPRFVSHRIASHRTAPPVHFRRVVYVDARMERDALAALGRKKVRLGPRRRRPRRGTSLTRPSCEAGRVSTRQGTSDVGSDRTFVDQPTSGRRTRVRRARGSPHAGEVPSGTRLASPAELAGRACGRERVARRSVEPTRETSGSRGSGASQARRAAEARGSVGRTCEALGGRGGAAGRRAATIAGGRGSRQARERSPRAHVRGPSTRTKGLAGAFARARNATWWNARSRRRRTVVARSHEKRVHADDVVVVVVVVDGRTVDEEAHVDVGRRTRAGRMARRAGARHPRLARTYASATATRRRDGRRRSLVRVHHHVRGRGPRTRTNRTSHVVTCCEDAQAERVRGGRPPATRFVSSSDGLERAHPNHNTRPGCKRERGGTQSKDACDPRSDRCGNGSHGGGRETRGAGRRPPTVENARGWMYRGCPFLRAQVQEEDELAVSIVLIFVTNFLHPSTTTRLASEPRRGRPSTPPCHLLHVSAPVQSSTCEHLELQTRRGFAALSTNHHVQSAGETGKERMQTAQPHPVPLPVPSLHILTSTRLGHNSPNP
mmetsp:Transcript_9828/g.59819  ORF Transcript_9828/g.59819 Transcript_9828/m.59819 type:complete len:612 (+) Transcript_9828:1227-3062(+)